LEETSRSHLIQLLCSKLGQCREVFSEPAKIFLLIFFFFSKYYYMYFLLTESLCSQYIRRNANRILLLGQSNRMVHPKRDTKLCIISVQRIIMILVSVSEA